jgi:Zn-dependent peptidase ImmA (M78 family)
MGPRAQWYDYRLEALAYNHLKIPLAVFFFPQPPGIEDPKANFRRLPDYELERFSPDTLQKIRLAQAYQDSLVELLEGILPERQIHRDLRPGDFQVDEFASETRNYLGITLKQQFRFRSNDQAFKAWRHSIENAGIFTFKDSFKDKFISGFCILNEDFPVIMVNNSNSFARQIFSLIHELGHILFGINGVTDVDDSYLRFMDTSEQALETKCNHFTAEVLVPGRMFQSEIPHFEEIGPKIISDLAHKYSVSREVILRRLFDHNAIDTSFYKDQAAKWNKDYLRSKRDSAGGDWYLTKLSYLGEGFTRLAFENYRKGRLDRSTLASHLNVKARNLNKFESYLW